MGYLPTHQAVIATLAVMIADPGAIHGQTPVNLPRQVSHFDLPSRNAAAGIAHFMRQARTIQILVSDDALRGRRTNRLKGSYTLESALDHLLANTGLRWLKTGDNSFSIVAVTPSTRTSSRP